MSGKINKKILKKALEKISVKTKGKIFNRSLDVRDFDISFVKGLSLEDGAATLTEYTSEIIVDEELFYLLDERSKKLLPLFMLATVIISFVEIIGIGLIYPFLRILIDPESSQAPPRPKNSADSLPFFLYLFNKSTISISFLFDGFKFFV